MQISAALIYDQALDDAARIEVEEYLQTKYIDDTFDFA
jgi:hypothetical protein